MNDNNQPTNYCAIGLSNPKSPGNVGAVVRACGCFDASHIYYTGRRYDRAEPFYTDTANRRDDIALTRVDNLAQTANKMVATTGSLKTICIELCENAIPLTVFQHPDQAFYLFGPEDSSLSQETIDAADHVVFIPTHGCLNLAASVNVLLYDRFMKRTPELNHHQRNELVRNSRDCKNNLIAGIDK